MITLYHGSDVLVEKPDFHYCKPYKDFGRGFYLSADKKQAEELARQRALQTNTPQGVVTSFLFDKAAMSSEELSVLIFEDYSEDWAKFVLSNRDRKLPQPIHNYDIVYGPIADDSVTFQLRRYMRGTIKTLSELIDELRYAKRITFQYYFGTQRALDKLIKI